MVDRLGTDNNEHGEIAELLPWLVSGGLQRAEIARAERHLQHCPACQVQLQFLRSLEETVNREAGQGWQASAGHFAGILAEVERLEAAAQTVPLRATVKPGLLRNLKRWLQQTPSPVCWAMAAQSVALLALLALWLGPQPAVDPSAYQTLSDPKPSAAAGTKTIRVLFAADGIDTVELIGLLRSAQAQIIEGPSDLGFFTLSVPAGQADAVLASFQGNPHIRIAQTAD
ncbi:MULTISPECIES: zf-HC2 domain-containing protein [Methylomonas]|uniref:zf-HC2 domain-containing protein n=1 Tax=Methylomonas TaxID=416 RepID=UPI001681A248|nr:zf-HC2 domain-containing protein [Methylomonas rhizoryzae]